MKRLDGACPLQGHVYCFFRKPQAGIDEGHRSRKRLGDHGESIMGGRSGFVMISLGVLGTARVRQLSFLPIVTQ